MRSWEMELVLLMRIPALDFLLGDAMKLFSSVGFPQHKKSLDSFEAGTLDLHRSRWILVDQNDAWVLNT